MGRQRALDALGVIRRGERTESEKVGDGVEAEGLFVVTFLFVEALLLSKSGRRRRRTRTRRKRRRRVRRKRRRRSELSR